MFQMLKIAFIKLKMNKKVYLIPLFCVISMLMVFGIASASFESGVSKYLRGDFGGCLPLFSDAFVKSPDNPVSKGVYSNSLIIFGKKSILDGAYLDGCESLEKALNMTPSLKNLRTLSLLAELEGRFPTNTEVATDEQLNSKEEKDMIFDLIFLGGDDPLPKEAVENASEKAHENEEDTIVIDNVKNIVHYPIGHETLSSIARAYYKKDLWQKVWKANPHIKNPHRIFPGEKVLIPMD